METLKKSLEKSSSVSQRTSLERHFSNSSDKDKIDILVNNMFPAPKSPGPVKIIITYLIRDHLGVQILGTKILIYW